jgi:polyphosphate kinase
VTIMISFQQSKTQSRFLTAATAGEGHFINRELSLLAFNERVLSLAMDPAVPLFERLRYVCIVSSNLDELFEIRVSGLKAKLKQQPTAAEADGSTAEASFNKIAARAQQLVAQQYEVLNNSILPQLAERDVVLHFLADFSAQQREWAHKYFMEEVLPVLTPIGLEPSHPFPRVLNKSLNFIVTLEGDDSYGRSSKLAVLQAPRILSRVTPVPKDISGIYQFRVTRNSDLFVDDEEVTDLREALRGELSQRQFGDAVRLEVSDTMPEDVVHRLLSEHQLTEKDCYRVKGPVNLVRMMNIPDLIDMPELKFPAYTPVYPSSFSAQEPFELIAKSDLLVHHPYESFSTVTDFIAAAARDPAVVAISMTIYRTGQTSEIMESLITAARSGKEVTAVVELMARFDEETNISWASRLENVGAHVVFGVVGNKTHAKMCLVVRREKTGLKRYVHLGTGNYHPRTARLYTDFGLFTADPMLCADAHEVFHQLTGLGKARPLRKLWQSPFTLHSQIIKAIRREVAIAKSGGRALVIAKMNSLVEPEVIEALYKASQAGVKVDLIVRGVCMLRPGIKGLSDNIRVRSVIGRFLEHSRIFYFRNNGADDLYLSSADWMDRNFFRRVEIAVPVLNRALKQRVLREGFRVHLQPSAQAWQMRPDGSYELKRPRGSAGASTAKHAISSQEQLQELICVSPVGKRLQKEKGK